MLHRCQGQRFICEPLALLLLEFTSLAALESKSPIAQCFLPIAHRTIREATGDDTVSGCDLDLALTQRDLASATLAASAKFMEGTTAGDQNLSASIRSSGGLGAGAWLRAPMKPCHRMLNMQLSICLRTRLHLDIPLMQGTCKHKRPDGTLCGAPLDIKGVHARSCAVGGWLVRRHNACVDILADWCVQCCHCQVFKEQVLPCANEAHSESRMDLIVHSPTIPGPIHVDVTIVSPLSVEALKHGSALRDGVAAVIAATNKVRKYPGCEVHPFAIEDHGRVGESASTLIRTLVPPESSDRSASISELYHSLSSTLQRRSAGGQ